MMGWICPVCGAARPPHWEKCCTAPVPQSGDASANAEVVALEPKTKRPSPKRRSYDDPLFDEFWSKYPLKLDKPKAYAAWQAALAQGAEPQRIIAGAQKYARYCRINEWLSPKYAQGWLNNERWNDELPLPREVGEGPSFEEQEAQRRAEEERAIREMA